MIIKGTNEKDHLIMKYNSNNGVWEDHTNRIIYLSDKNQKSWYIIELNSKGEKIQYYAKFNEVKATNIYEKIEFDKNNVFINSKKIDSIDSIYYFPMYGYKVFFNNLKTIFIKQLMRSEDRKIYIFYHNTNKSLNNPIFDYYISLAKEAAERSHIGENDEDTIEDLLYKLYLSIDEIKPTSVLHSYTNQSINKQEYDERKLIFPFKTNYSQIQAIKSAFSNQLSVISGPPGTGKTQVILNLIFNALIRGMKIAVISNNNTAVENIYDKLKEKNFDFFVAYLGNSKKVTSFFENQKNLSTELKNIVTKNENEFNNLNELMDLFNKQNVLSKSILEYKELKEEQKHYMEHYTYKDMSTLFKNPKICENYSFLNNFKYYLLSLRKMNFFNKLIIKYKYKLNTTKFNVNDFVEYIDYMFFIDKLRKKEIEINDIESYLKENNIDSLSKKLEEYSQSTLNSYLVNKYSDFEELQFSYKDYKNHFNAFVNRYPVILSTTQSLLRNTAYDYMYDLVIIDEASQSDILTSILSMNVTRNMVIVGDAKQLSQIDNQSIYGKARMLNKVLSIDNCFRYEDNSILNSVLNLKCFVPNVVLKEHYRCDSRIIEFCNRKFYNGELIIKTDTSKTDPMIVIYTVEGNHARKNPNGTGQYNDREAQEILEILRNEESNDIGIISPFNAQVNYIRKLINKDYSHVEVDTIHKYQGRQKEIIILSTVVNDIKDLNEDFITNFVTNPKLLNVAISRAVKKIYLVVSHGVYTSKQNTISQLIDYIKYYNDSSTLKEGKVVSIFDKLYDKSMENIRNSNCIRYVDSYAEKLMLDYLNNILKDYSDYRIILHYRLKYLINDYDGFNKDEINYINHPKTHVDFTIFDMTSYKPVLCIEVDGTKYHDYNKVQINHDKIKNRIIKHNNIPFLRIKTNKSNEELVKKYL